MAKLEGVIREIKKILKKDVRGLTVKELSEKTKVSRITVAIALAHLEGQGLLDIRIIGNCKLHYLKGGSNKK